MKSLSLLWLASISAGRARRHFPRPSPIPADSAKRSKNSLRVGRQNRLFFSSRLLRRSRASAKNLHWILLHLQKARRNVEQASVEQRRRERSYRRGHFH